VSEIGVEYGAVYELIGPDGTRVVFNDSTDKDFVGMLSPESSGLDSPEVREDAQDSTEADGGVHGDFFLGRRPVILQGTVIATSKLDRNKKVAKIKRAGGKALREDAILSWKPEGAEEKVRLRLRLNQPLRFTKGFVKDFFLPMVSADAYVESYATSVVTAYEPVALLNPSALTTSIAPNATYLFWGRSKNIGRAKLDGTEVNTKLIATTNTVTAVVANATHIFWAHGDAIGRAKVDGTEVNQEFIKLAASSAITDIAINATHIFATRSNSSRIAIDKIEGGGLNENFITTGTLPMAVAVNSTHIFWSSGTGGEGLVDIGRATVAGASINNEFIANVSVEQINWIDFDTTYIYYVLGSRIYRRLIDGSGKELPFASAASELKGFAIEDKYLYYGISTSILRVDMGDFTATVNGDADSFPIMKIYAQNKEFGGGEFLEIKNVTTGKSLWLTITNLDPGEFIEIDFKNATIVHSADGNIYKDFLFEVSEWWKLEPGANVIRFSVPTLKVETSYRNAYL
jgi:virginiamycin B lyase